MILGCSADSAKRNGNFRKRHDLSFALLCDPDHHVISAYGAWGEKKMMGRKCMGIIRSTFVIDEEGVVMAAFPKVKVSGHEDEVLAVL